MQNRIANVESFRVNEFLIAKSVKGNSRFNAEADAVKIAAPISISFNPGSKLMEFVWQRPVSSNEYRQCIRFIGLCVAILRVEFILVDFRKMGNPTLEEQKTTEHFLRNALKNSTVIRSARVIANTRSQQEVYNAILKSNLTLPYQVKGFLTTEEAKDWLFREPFIPTANPEHKVLIPVHCSLKDLKKFASDNLEVSGVVHAHPEENTLKTSRCHNDFMEIIIDHQNSLLQLRWLRKTTSREYRYGILKASRSLIEKQLVNLLVNNQRQSALTLQDQTWLVTLMKPILYRSKVEKIGVVLSSDMMQQMVSESLTKRIVQHNSPYRAKHFLSEEEAKDWLCIPRQEKPLV